MHDDIDQELKGFKKKCIQIFLENIHQAPDLNSVVKCFIKILRKENESKELKKMK